MRLKEQLTSTLAQLASLKHPNNVMSCEQLMALIDLTRLDSAATPSEIQALAIKANQHQVAAICVLPEHLGFISSKIDTTRATVINFPTGNQAQKEVLASIEQLATYRSAKLNEIDYVFPYQAFLAGDQNKALHNCREVYHQCKQHDFTFKVILETGALPSIDIIYDMSLAVIDTGCDFLKTSTGKIATGATIPAAFAILAAIMERKANCGIKVSGGVKAMDQALSYTQIAQYMLNRDLDNTCFRIGASSLLDDLIQHLHH